MSYTITDNADAVKAAVEKATRGALEAIGIEAVGHIREQMDSGYSTPHGNPPHTSIRETSALINDVQYDVQGDRVEVGNTIKYADYVYFGTARMEGRPYIMDAVNANQQRYEDILSEMLGGIEG